MSGCCCRKATVGLLERQHLDCGSRTRRRLAQAEHHHARETKPEPDGHGRAHAAIAVNVDVDVDVAVTAAGGDRDHGSVGNGQQSGAAGSQRHVQMRGNRRHDCVVRRRCRARMIGRWFRRIGFACKSKMALEKAEAVHKTAVGQEAAGQRYDPGAIEYNWFSYVTLGFVWPLLKRGYQTPIQEQDLPALHVGDRSKTNAHIVDAFWRKVAAHTARPDAVPAPSFLLTVASHFIWLFLADLLFSALGVAAAIAMPLMIGQIMASLDNPQPALLSSPYFLAVAFFVLQVLSALSSSTAKSIANTMTNRTRSVVMSAIYRKSLLLSPAARVSFPPGTIQTMLTSDASSLYSIGSQAIGLVFSLLQIFLAVYYLSLRVGWVAWIVAIAFILAVQLGVTPSVGSAYSGFSEQMSTRTRRLREFLYGVRIIKLQATEETLVRLIGEARADQVDALRKYLVPVFWLYVVSIIEQNLVPVGVVVLYGAFSKNVGSESVFTILALLGAAMGPSATLSTSVATVMKFKVSYARVTALLLAPEVQPEEVTAFVDEGQSDDGSVISLSSASFTWEQVKADDEDQSKEEPFKLEDLNLSIPRGSLVAVVGSVGSGKSSFLSALIGGMRKTAGSSSVFGSIAYCAQEPWILTGTVEENIVFSDESVRPNIAKAVSASCLEHDLELLPNGLGTQIGEKGINLSGGQKARVALARAIARDADIYLLDDPIAALDAHVGKKVFDEAICGTLKSKTVVLVTHQLHLLPKVDFVVVLDNGRVAETGTFKDLMAVPESALSGIMKDYHFDDEEAEDSEEDKEEAKEDDEIIKAIKAYEDEAAIAEDRREGVVTFETFRSYFLAAGKAFFGILITLFLISMGVNALVRISLVVIADNRWGWTIGNYLIYYGSIGLFDTILTLGLQGLLFIAAFKAACVLHDRALDGLVRAPMSFFDSQPIGRILNRMTADVSSLDMSIGEVIATFSDSAVSLGSSLIVVIYTSPWLIGLCPSMLCVLHFQPAWTDVLQQPNSLSSLCLPGTFCVTTWHLTAR
ncbi:hypothetical protein BC831DRAFT_281279 [Entophlyctis helioformis]|nr:hypothetical protein BC831DRAFT_281279 [Entophlyctis helioformis]